MRFLQGPFLERDPATTNLHGQNACPGHTLPMQDMALPGQDHGGLTAVDLLHDASSLFLVLTPILDGLSNKSFMHTILTSTDMYTALQGYYTSPALPEGPMMQKFLY